MGIEYAVWVPAIVVAHHFGALFLLYGLEKSTGVVSQMLAKFRGGRRTPKAPKRPHSLPTSVSKAVTARRRSSHKPSVDKAQQVPPVQGAFGGGMARMESKDSDAALLPSPEALSSPPEEAQGALKRLGTPRVSNDWNSSQDAQSVLHSARASERGLHKAAPRWQRGCTCEGSCQHLNRWVPPTSERSTQTQPASNGPSPGPSTFAPLSVEGPLLNTVHEGEEEQGDELLVEGAADLAWVDLAVEVVDKKTLKVKPILHPSSGVIVPGELAGLVGPSGAGKSTLLDVLAQRRGAARVEGRLWMNGAPLGARYKRGSAYVPQEDIFVATLSTWETLRFHAILRSPKGTSQAVLDRRMTRVLTVMGLMRVKDTQVGGPLPGGITVRGLSGGEKRRLSIACSLVGRPSLLFLDEPTTGLDSFAALNIMDHMASLAAVGHTVIASIHQPRAAIWAILHKVVVLSEGRQMYMGPPEGAISWFDGTLKYPFHAKNGSASDWLMDLVSVSFAKPPDYASRTMRERKDVEEAAERWAVACATAEGADTGYLASLRARSGESTKPVGDEVSRFSVYATSWGTQFRQLVYRTLLAQLRNPTDVASRLLLSCWAAAIGGLVFWSLPSGAPATFLRLAVLFYVMLLFQLLPFCYLSFYVADRHFFNADVAAELYHPSAYYVANTVAAAPFVALNTLVGLYSMWGFAGLRYTAWAILEAGGLTVLYALVSIQMLTFCVYLTTNQDIAYVAAVGYTALCILLSGFAIRITDLKIQPLIWLSYISFTRWGFHGLAHIDLANRDFLGPTGCEKTNTCLVVGNGNDVLKYWGLTLNVPEAVGVLFIFYAFFHAASYLAMRYLHRHSK